MKASDWINIGDRLPNATYRERDCEFSDVVLLCLQENEGVYIDAKWIEKKS